MKLKAMCNQNGREIDPSKSAEVIYQLGVEHLKLSPDKISLIKCIGLLNCAIARKPENVSEIEKHLFEICQHILHQANAQDQTVRLTEKAKQIKVLIEKMRSETIQKLAKQTFKKTLTIQTNTKEKQEQKIKAMKSIQLQITESYNDIMIDLSTYSVNVMGPPPCKFAVVGMGSFSRKVITPYSDFEHIILLEEVANGEYHLEYFRWFSVIFHIVILNLQETMIPRLHISFLNDSADDFGDWFFDTHTSSIAFDGMMPHACKFPLGRTQHTEKKTWTTELIKPVNKMLEYLSSEVSLKNGYHLSDVLKDTCFVFGDQALHDKFKNGIQFYKASKTRDELLDEIRKQVQEDFDTFSTKLKLTDLKDKKQLNLKQLFYRTSTAFISVLGKIFNIESSSCFDIINELAEKNVISKSTERNLLYAVAIACNIRLAVYLKEKSQRDYIQPKENAQTIFDDILNLVELNDIISYFHITYCLQQEFISIMEIQKSYFYQSPALLNITICLVFGLDYQFPKILDFLQDGVALNSSEEDNKDDEEDENDDDDNNKNSLRFEMLSVDKNYSLCCRDSNCIKEIAVCSNSKADVSTKPADFSRSTEVLFESNADFLEMGSNSMMIDQLNLKLKCCYAKNPVKFRKFDNRLKSLEKQLYYASMSCMPEEPIPNSESQITFP